MSWPRSSVVAVFKGTFLWTSSTHPSARPSPTADQEDLPLRSRWANRLVVTAASLLLAAAGLLLLRATAGASALHSRRQVQLQLARQTQELNSLLAREKKAV